MKRSNFWIMFGVGALFGEHCFALGFIVPHDQYAKPTEFHVLLEWDDQAKRERLTVQAFFETDAPELWVFLPVPGTPEVIDTPARMMEGLAVATLLDPVPPQMGGEFNRGTYHVQDICFETMNKLAEVRQSNIDGPQMLIRPERDHAEKWFAELGMTENVFTDRVLPYTKDSWSMIAWKLLPDQLPRNRYGRYEGATPPLCVEFESSEPVYPMRGVAVRDGLTVDYQFSVIAPEKRNLPGSFSYLHTWVKVLQEGQKALQREGKARPGGINIIVEKYLEHLDHYRQQVKDMQARGWKSAWLLYAGKLDKEFDSVESLRRRFVRYVENDRLEALNFIEPRLEPGKFVTVIRKRLQSPEMNQDLVFHPAADELVGDGTFHTHWIPRERSMLREVWK
jgi:hypothetical protein